MADRYYIYNTEAKMFWKYPEAGLTSNKNYAHAYSVEEIAKEVTNTKGLEFIPLQEPNSITISYDPSAELIEINGTTYAKQKPVAPEPKKRLSREDIYELENILSDMKLVDASRSYSNCYKLIRERRKAELFLCIECLKLGGECFGNAYHGSYFYVYTPDLLNGKWEPMSYASNHVNDFYFNNPPRCTQFLAIPGVIDALNTHRMVG